ncbi:MAG: hypothetical protein H0U92_12520 [Actinobacteria bacterium]|nr:hypothetical protein [Actinomycetota bacterium]
MPDQPPEPDEIDARRVRIGLAILVVVVVGALIGAVVLDNPTGKVVMIGIVAFTVIRAWTLRRALGR